jgi:transcriptional regulator with XRE-family HTH domain
MLERFPEKLKLLRRQHHLSQQQLANQLGIAESYIGHLENGKRKPGTEISIKIADFFGIALDALVRDELDLELDEGSAR